MMMIKETLHKTFQYALNFNQDLNQNGKQLQDADKLNALKSLKNTLSRQKPNMLHLLKVIFNPSY